MKLKQLSSSIIRCWTPSQNTLILLNKNPKIYESVLDKEVNIGQKVYDFLMVSQAAFERIDLENKLLHHIASYCIILFPTECYKYRSP